ncbi:YdbL family protein [Sphingomonas sp. RB56-2]|uniref:YdbL family protein n=1 Tax=Sphingomonas brevis TaxID=2908206 RepID=A0ABT0S9H0_9SPHN|nr:YdbL family protein [Sphingomonas brevis]MCL6740721.1 YdbL family protein [Sphingomonas brevis]
MRKLVLIAVGIAGLAAPASVPAQDPAAIVAAKRAGQIGERYDGYIGYVGVPSAALRREVDAINIRRRSLYSGLATRKGVSPQEVGITAACSLLRRINVGEYYLSGQGGWQRYAVGRNPVPDYCG